MALQSLLFRDDPKLRRAATQDAGHITKGSMGEHVRKIQIALNILDGVAIAEDGIYGPETAAAVLAYKRKRDIVNRHYQTHADDITGKMTMASLDAEMRALVARLIPIIGGAGGRFNFLLAGTLATGVSTPKAVILTEPDADSVRWAQQVVAFTQKLPSSAPVMPAMMVKVDKGKTPAEIAAIYKTAASQAGAGGCIVISVGHGGKSPQGDPDVGLVDLGPNNSFKVAGRNNWLVGEWNQGVQAPLTIPPDLKDPPYFHTEPFYADPKPKPRQSRKEDDEQSGSPGAKVRLANWQAYQDICAALQSQKLGCVALITCVVGNAPGMLRKMAQQWGCGIWAYKRLVTIVPASNGRERARFDTDSEGTNPAITTNTPLAEVMPPPSSDGVWIMP
jgi:peptidoglycan hydrolase-like protein with peptidoglycan-binding domain